MWHSTSRSTATGIAGKKPLKVLHEDLFVSDDIITLFNRNMED